jgi:hypothetical protein
VERAVAKKLVLGCWALKRSAKTVLETASNEDWRHSAATDPPTPRSVSTTAAGHGGSRGLPVRRRSKIGPQILSATRSDIASTD